MKHFKTFFPEGLVLFLKNKAKIYINNYHIFLAFSWGCVPTLFLSLCLYICWYCVSFDLYLDVCTRRGIILYYRVYLECQSVCPFVRIGSPPPSFRNRVLSPTLEQKKGGGGGHTRLRGEGTWEPIRTTGEESLALCLLCACTVSVYVHVVSPDICLLISCYNPACMEGFTLIGIFGIWIHISICISCGTSAYIGASVWNY